MVSTVEHFPHAPITEAIVDIRTTLPSHVDLARLATFQDAVKANYPQKRERFSWQGGFGVKEGVVEVLKPSGGPDGYLFTSKDGLQVAQARLDGFTFSRLKPYQDWATLRKEANTLWKHFVDIASPITITRLALRYINRIELPLPVKDFKDYILTVPEVAPSLPQGLANFVMRLTIPEDKLDAVATVTELMETPIQREGKEVLPIILDIDVYRQSEWAPQAAEVWDFFEVLHTFKNQVFFGSITERTKQLFR